MSTGDEWIIKVDSDVFKFNQASSQLFDSSDQEIHLQPKEKRLLLYCLRNPQRVLTYDDLANDVWERKHVEDSAIAKVVRSTRKSLNDREGTYSISTQPKEGFRFDGQIVQSPQNSVQLDIRNNGSKILDEVVSLWAYRSEFDKGSKTAKLYCEVSFNDGRFSGSDSKDRVGFRLTLNKAELYIDTDSAKVLQIRPNSVEENRSTVSGNINVHRGPITPSSAVLRFECAGENEYLKGAVWADGLKNQLLQVRDTRQASGNEPPEMEVQIRCRREDMNITDIHFVNSEDMDEWKSASPEKRLAVTQYLREELINRGLQMGDMQDPFSEFILATAITQEDNV